MAPGQASDEALMEQVARDCRDSLETLVRRYANRLLTFITRMTGDRHRSEELFQEVFLAVWIKRSQYNPHYRRFQPWLYRIAINTCRAAFRRRMLPVERWGNSEIPALVHAGDTGPDEGLSATETDCLVANGVATLPVMQRTVLVLRIWSGLSYEEIAAAIGRTVPTVRSHMHHALAGLREYMEPRLR